MNITNAELTMLGAVTTSDGWNKACAAIKAVRGGTYPLDWWAKVKLTGLMDHVMSRFGETSDLKVEKLTVTSDGRIVP